MSTGAGPGAHRSSAPVRIPHGILDRAPKGRDEGDAFQGWIRRTTSTKHGPGGCDGTGQPGAFRRREPDDPGPGGRLHVTDHPGQDPPLVLLHGFPDDSRIYDRLVPLLAPRRAIALDWLGYGRSDRVEPGSLDDAPHQHQLRAVLDWLQLDRVALVGHDAGGPDAIEYALREPGRVDQLILSPPLTMTPVIVGSYGGLGR